MNNDTCIECGAQLPWYLAWWCLKCCPTDAMNQTREQEDKAAYYKFLNETKGPWDGE